MTPASQRPAPALVFVGAAEPQIAMMRAARALGLYVVGVDRNPDAAARGAADEFHVVDATDVAGVLALARGLAESRGLAGAYGVADYANRTVGAVLELAGAGHGTAAAFARAADKVTSREAWLAAGLPMARGTCIGPDEPAMSAALPRAGRLVVKPARGHNSLGVRSVEAADADGLAAAVAAARAVGGDVLVEEHIEGEHVNVDGVLVDGTLHPLVVTRRGFVSSPHHQPAWGLQPASPAAADERRLFALAEQAAVALGMRATPMTADLVITPDGPRVLEVSPHLHAAAVTQLLDGGAGLSGWFARLAGHDFQPPRRVGAADGAAAYCYVYAFRSGVVEAFDGLDAVAARPEVRDVIVRAGPGARVDAADGRGALSVVLHLAAARTDQVMAVIDEIAAGVRVLVRERAVPAGGP